MYKQISIATQGFAEYFHCCQKKSSQYRKSPYFMKSPVHSVQHQGAQLTPKHILTKKISNGCIKAPFLWAFGFSINQISYARNSNVPNLPLIKLNQKLPLNLWLIPAFGFSVAYVELKTSIFTFFFHEPRVRLYFLFYFILLGLASPVFLAGIPLQREPITVVP